MLSLFAVASIGLCSSFTASSKHSVAKPAVTISGKSPSSLFQGFTIRSVTVVFGSLRQNYEGTTVTPHVLTLSNGSNHTDKLFITSVLSWSSLSTKTYNDPAIRIMQGSKAIIGNTDVVKTDREVKCKFTGRTADGKSVMVMYDISF